MNFIKFNTTRDINNARTILEASNNQSQNGILSEERIAKFLTSLKAVLIPMLMLQGALIIDAAILVHRSFPEIPAPFKIVASALLGFALAFPLLLSSVNSYILKDLRVLWFTISFPMLFAGFTVFMSLLFFRAFDPQPTWNMSNYILVYFLSIFFGLIEYLYADLFVKKNQQRIKDLHLKEGFAELQVKHSELKINFHELKEDQVQLKKAYTQLNQDYAKLKEQVVCKHCGHESDTLSKAKYHQTNCPENPKNLES